MIEESSPLETLPKPGSTAVPSESKLHQNPRSNPVCLEVGVTIRRSPEEGDERSPSPAKAMPEEARTVIVFDNGAVLRLTTNIPPGQAVILSNPQGRDVVCRIVNNRNSPNVKGYIEIEFLEATTDFWGIHKRDGQSNVSKPSAAVVTQPKAVAQPQTVSVAPPLEAPAPVREQPVAPELIAATGVAASLERPGGGVQESPTPPSRAKVPEPATHSPDSKHSDHSGPYAVDGGRSYSPTGASAPATELTSLSANWEGTPPLARSPSTSNDILGKFSHTTSGSASTGSGGKTPWIVGAVAAILIALGAGVFLMRRGSAVLPATPLVAAVSHPTTQVPPVPVSIPTSQPPAPVEQAIAEPSPQASPLSPEFSRTSPAPKEIADAVAPSLQQAPRRPMQDLPATQSNQLNSEQPGPSTPKSLASRNLNMTTPTDASRSGKLVDSSVPDIDDATVSGSVGLAGGGLLSTVSHPIQPPPPAGFVGASSPGETASEPKLISSSRPVYPQVAKQASIEGDVNLAVDIDARGNVVGAKASAGPMYLRQAAVDAVKRWQYKPAYLNGKPTATHISITIQFRLK
jgi:protein TonB